MKLNPLPRATGHVGLALFIASTCGSLACASFDDPSTIKDLRLLAVRAEPSELIISDLSAPPPVIKLWPLLADASGIVTDASFTVIGCPNNPMGPTPPIDPMASGGFPAGGARGTLSSSLCPTDPRAADYVWPLASSADMSADGSVSVTLSAEQIAAALAVDRFPDKFGHSHGGFDLGLPINLEFDITRGDQVVKGVKRVLFWFPTLVPVIEGELPNNTPVISSVQRAPSRDENAVLQEPEPFDMVDVPTVAPGHPLWIAPALGEQEPFITTVLDTRTSEVTAYPVAQETLRYSYFATLGKFAPGSVSTDPPGGAKWKDGLPHVESRYEAPPLAELPLDPVTQVHAADVTVWIVVRDDRGGTSWAERHLRVTE